MIKGKTPEEIRKTFNIKNDFTPAEEEQVTMGDCFVIDALSLDCFSKQVEPSFSTQKYSRNR